MIKEMRALVLMMMVGLPLWLTSCLNTGDNFADPNVQLQKDTIAIDNYLNNVVHLSAERDPYGLRMVITKLGTGLPANIYDEIEVDYVGKFFPNGATFDQGNIKGPPSGFIAGWQDAFTTLPEGSKATLYIPSGMAYGTQGQGSIPPNSILEFNVDFKRVKKSTAQLQKFGSDTVAIDAYLTNKPIVDVIRDTTGLRYKITTVGIGPSPTWYDKVKFNYSIKLLTTTDDTELVFQDEQKPSAYFYSRVVDYIHGIKIGLHKLSKGGKATLYIPSGLGFGVQDAKDNTGAVVVPGNSNLIIEIELVDIVQ